MVQALLLEQTYQEDKLKQDIKNLLWAHPSSPCTAQEAAWEGYLLSENLSILQLKKA